MCITSSGDTTENSGDTTLFLVPLLANYILRLFQRVPLAGYRSASLSLEAFFGASVGLLSAIDSY